MDFAIGQRPKEAGGKRGGMDYRVSRRVSRRSSALATLFLFLLALFCFWNYPERTLSATAYPIDEQFVEPSDDLCPINRAVVPDSAPSLVTDTTPTSANIATPTAGPPATQTQTIFTCQDVWTTIPDMSTLTDFIKIPPEQKGTLSDLSISFQLIHLSPLDLQISLFQLANDNPPTITSSILVANNFSCKIDSPAWFEFGDAARQGQTLGNITDCSELIAPQVPFSVFYGKPIAGEWSLVVDDQTSGGEGGVLYEWCLTATVVF